MATKAKYKVESMHFSELKNSVQVPKYQRKLVWSDKQKRDFILNISHGYPFGSILLYRYDNEAKLSLIDGLQRFTTMVDFQENPAKYFMDYEKYIDKIIGLIEGAWTKKGGELGPETRRAVEDDVLEILKSFLQEQKPSPLYIREAVKQCSWYIESSESDDELLMLQDRLREDVETYLDLENLLIPCVVFTGDESELPDVFSNLNQGGTKLSKYQVLAAQWTRHDFELPRTGQCDVLLNKVIDRYERLVDERNLEIEDFDRDEFFDGRRINLSEYCFALGEMIAEAVPAFWSSAAGAKGDAEDTFNVVGYLSVAVALGVDNRRIATLAKKSSMFQSPSFIGDLTELILKQYEEIQRRFEDWIKVPGTAHTSYENGAITDMQALSFFAALWHIRYQLNESDPKIEVRQGCRARYEESLKNLVSYCVVDVVSRAWQGSGDSRLANFYVDDAESRNSYRVPIQEDLVRARLGAWLDETTQSGSIRVERISKLLLCVLAADDRTTFKSRKYDIEHVISQKLLKKNKIYKNESIPGGTLGNIMYLAVSTNRGKRERNLFFVDDHEHAAINEELLARDFYPNRREMAEAEADLERGDAEAAKRLIKSRGKEMIERLVKILAG